MSDYAQFTIRFMNTAEKVARLVKDEDIQNSPAHVKSLIAGLRKAHEDLKQAKFPKRSDNDGDDFFHGTG